MSLIFFGASFIAFVAATTLAIDVGMWMNARTQAQTAADSGALSGATALAYNSFTDRSASGPAVQSAMSAAKANKVIGYTPTVDPADVTFPTGPTGLNNRVQVDVHRAGTNAVQTLIGSLFGLSTVNINTQATAEASPANAMQCVKPFMIPDRWEETNTPPWDPTDVFNMYDNKGNLLPVGVRDVYIPVRNCPTCKDNTAYTGYNANRDKGMRLTIRAGTGNNIEPTFYFSWKMPGDIGGDFYRDNIAGCNTNFIHWFDLMTQEPGNMSGPTIQGINDLIAKDPNAYWDTACNCVKGSAFSVSPRVFPIPLYDPWYYDEGKANGRTADFRVANFLGFFVEPPQGNNIPGRITPISGVIDDGGGPAPVGMFPISIRLVK